MENELTPIQNNELTTSQALSKIENMLTTLCENQDKIKEQLSNNSATAQCDFIDVDLREIDAFSYVHQVFDSVFSKLNYAQEYIPFWLIEKERKFLEKKLNKSLKLVTKLYRKQLRKEKRAKRKSQFFSFFRKKR